MASQREIKSHALFLTMEQGLWDPGEAALFEALRHFFRMWRRQRLDLETRRRMRPIKSKILFWTSELNWWNPSEEALFEALRHFFRLWRNQNSYLKAISEPAHKDRHRAYWWCTKTTWAGEDMDMHVRPSKKKLKDLRARSALSQSTQSD